MATTKDVERLPSGKLKYRGETFPGYNKPKKTPGGSKKSAVLAKKGKEVKIVRFGDPNMSIKKDQPARRKSFMARFRPILSKVRGQKSLSPAFWAIRTWQKGFKL